MAMAWWIAAIAIWAAIFESIGISIVRRKLAATREALRGANEWAKRWEDDAAEAKHSAAVMLGRALVERNRWQEQTDFYRERFRRALFMAHDARARAGKVEAEARRIVVAAMRDREAAALYRQSAAIYAQLLRDCPMAHNSPGRAEREWRARADTVLSVAPWPDGNRITSVQTQNSNGH